MVMQQLRFYRSQLALLLVLVVLGCALFNCYMPKSFALNVTDSVHIDARINSPMLAAPHCNSLSGCLLEATLGMSLSLLALVCFILLFALSRLKDGITLAISRYAFRTELPFLHLYNFPRLHLTYCTWLN
ncbi:hypothetical protein A9R01_12360 ['Osedax' symbiont bacterium Rs2_46_30_T18]|nr:hypothetical protein A9R01_12360 ['Osedax' symbiont bacterium Rs2_46_30_T18]